MREATDAASTNAVLTTFVGSMMPYVIIFTKISLEASKPISSSYYYNNLPTTTAPSPPAFSTIALIGNSIAFFTICIPIF